MPQLYKAREYAFLLLKFRLRSEKEIYARLKNKKFPEEIIKETISFLKEKRFIDDEVFAKSWIDSRLKRPLGLGRIEQELKTKGIDKEIIELELARIKKDYPEEEIIKQIVQDKFAKLKDVEPRKAKRRLYAYLLRRGFSSDSVGDIISQTWKQMP
jgi:regulatory protein